MGVSLEVEVIPSSKRYGMQFKGSKITVMVKEPPIQGKANNGLLDFIAKKIGVRRENIRIVSGLRSRRKILEILEDISHEELKRRLSL